MKPAPKPADHDPLIIYTDDAPAWKVAGFWVGVAGLLVVILLMVGRGHGQTSPTTAQKPSVACYTAENCSTCAKFCEVIYPKPEPIDVPAIMKGRWSDSSHFEGAYTCADRSRILLTSEDGKEHCIKFH